MCALCLAHSSAHTWGAHGYEATHGSLLGRSAVLVERGRGHTCLSTLPMCAPQGTRLAPRGPPPDTCALDSRVCPTHPQCSLHECKSQIPHGPPAAPAAHKQGTLASRDERIAHTCAAQTRPNHRTMQANPLGAAHPSRPTRYHNPEPLPLLAIRSPRRLTNEPVALPPNVRSALHTQRSTLGGRTDTRQHMAAYAAVLAELGHTCLPTLPRCAPQDTHDIGDAHPSPRQ